MLVTSIDASVYTDFNVSRVAEDVRRGYLQQYESEPDLVLLAVPRGKGPTTRDALIKSLTDQDEH